MVTADAVKSAIDGASGINFTSHEVVEYPPLLSAWVIPTGFG